MGAYRLYLFITASSFEAICKALKRCDWVKDCGAKHDTFATLKVHAKRAGMVYLTILSYFL